MAKRVLDEGIINKIIQRVISLVAGGNYRTALKAFRNDRDLQKDIREMQKIQQRFEDRLNKRLKDDPEFKKGYEKNLKLFK